MPITARELAGMLGVSTATVSIALNGKKGISDETRKMILDAAAQYGVRKDTRYNAASRLITLVVYKKHGKVYGETPFFSALIEGISAQVVDSGYRLQLTYFYASQDPAEQCRSIFTSGSEGLILLATEMMEEDFPPFANAPIPVVMLDCDLKTSCYDCVTIHNQQGVYLAVKHLLDNGHRKLGYLRSSVVIPNFTERYVGYEMAIASSPFREQCSSQVVRVSSTVSAAYEDMNAYLARNPQLPTAFFADNDIIAGSCIRALIEHGYRIPEDISIVGFDDIPSAVLSTPALTTVHVPKEHLGRYAVQRLIDRIQSGDSTPTVRHSINTSLVIRDTVKRMA